MNPSLLSILYVLSAIHILSNFSSIVAGKAAVDDGDYSNAQKLLNKLLPVPHKALKKTLSRPNILMILVDDLGFGDLSVPPFNHFGAKTPELERMAAAGLVLTNFHAAAPICTPSRASVLTGLFPWRLGIYNIFGSSDLRNCFLPTTTAAATVATSAISSGGTVAAAINTAGVAAGSKGSTDAINIDTDRSSRSSSSSANHNIRTLPQVFRDAGYHTAHVGKWHLGGLRPEDVRARKAITSTTSTTAATAASRKSQVQNSTVAIHPGPLQHGFSEYVAMEEGPGSVRLSQLLPSSTLYHHGSRYLLRNDQPLLLSTTSNSSNSNGGDILTDRQAAEVIAIMNRTLHSGNNFYLHLWFDAPHSPWEVIHPFDRWYSSSSSSSSDSITSLHRLPYLSMISSMDAAVGRVLRALRALNAENNTLVVFFSDNGPENGAGSAHPFRGRKRQLLQGGIRVPSIWQWPGVIAAGAAADFFTVATDLFPTLVHAAQLPQQQQQQQQQNRQLLPHWRVVANATDGISVLPLLLAAVAGKKNVTSAAVAAVNKLSAAVTKTAARGTVKTDARHLLHSSSQRVLWSPFQHTTVKQQPQLQQQQQQQQQQQWEDGNYTASAALVATSSRLVTWFSAIPTATAAGRRGGRKYLITKYGAQHLFDLRADPAELTDALDGRLLSSCLNSALCIDAKFNSSSSSSSGGKSGLYEHLNISENLRDELYDLTNKTLKFAREGWMQYGAAMRDCSLNSAAFSDVATSQFAAPKRPSQQITSYYSRNSLSSNNIHINTISNTSNTSSISIISSNNINNGSAAATSSRLIKSRTVQRDIPYNRQRPLGQQQQQQQQHYQQQQRQQQQQQQQLRQEQQQQQRGGGKLESELQQLQTEIEEEKRKQRSVIMQQQRQQQRLQQLKQHDQLVKQQQMNRQQQQLRQRQHQ